MDIRHSLNLELAALRDGAVLAGAVLRPRADALHLPDDIHTIYDLPKHHVPPVQPLRLGGADEELRAVGARAGVSHGEDARRGVLELEVLIVKLCAVDALAARAVACTPVSDEREASGGSSSGEVSMLVEEGTA
jgi:hypothetical protein